METYLSNYERYETYFFFVQFYFNSFPDISLSLFLHFYNFFSKHFKTPTSTLIGFYFPTIFLFEELVKEFIYQFTLCIKERERERMEKKKFKWSEIGGWERERKISKRVDERKEGSYKF